MDRFCCSSEVSSASSFCSQSSHLLPSSWRGRWLRLTHLSEKWTLKTANLNMFVPKWSQQKQQNHSLGPRFLQAWGFLILANYQTGPRVNDCVSPLPKVLVVFLLRLPCPMDCIAHYMLLMPCPWGRQESQSLVVQGSRSAHWHPVWRTWALPDEAKQIIDPFKSEGDGNHPFLE